MIHLKQRHQLCIIFVEPEERGDAAEKSQLYHVMSYLVKKLAAWWKKYIFHTARRTIKSVITLTPTP